MNSERCPPSVVSRRKAVRHTGTRSLQTQRCFHPHDEERRTLPRLTNHSHPSVLAKWLCVYKPPLTFASQRHDVARFLHGSVPELSLIQRRPGSCLYYADSFKCNSRSGTSIPFGLVRPVFVCHSSLTALFSQKLSP